MAQTIKATKNDANLFIILWSVDAFVELRNEGGFQWIAFVDNQTSRVEAYKRRLFQRMNE